MTAGRPRQFDYDEALDKAMHVFWQKGFEGTSMPDLTDAMGMNRPSIYSSFGNKEELYRKALERYSERSFAIFKDKLSAPKLRDAIEGLLCGAAQQFSCGEKMPKGCMAVQGGLVGSDDADGACEQNTAQREAMMKLLQDRCKQGVSDGELPPGTDTKAMARYISTIINGMAVQSAGGVPGKELKAVAQMALSIFPA